MREDDNTAMDRRSVVKAVGGAGALGLATRPVSAGDDYDLGPLADVPRSERLTFEELGEVLQSDDNGAVRVRGDVSNVVRYVGDNRDLTASEIEREFDDVSADSVTLPIGCASVPLIGNVCAELELNFGTSGVTFDLIVGGFAVASGDIDVNGTATFSFDVPYLPVSGEATVTVDRLNFCELEVSATATLTVNGVQYGPYSNSASYNVC